MRRKSRVIQKRIRNRRLIKFSVALCLVFALVVSFGSMISYAGSDQRQMKESYKYYTSIQLAQGDTLASIASQFMTEEYENADAYIQEVAQMNHIDSEKPIHAGQYLIVPYFSSEIK